MRRGLLDAGQLRLVVVVMMMMMIRMSRRHLDQIWGRMDDGRVRDGEAGVLAVIERINGGE
jgi:hypothetical protein